MDPRRRSAIVVLTLIGLPFGAVALSDAVPSGQEMRRNLYPDRGACERDYSPAQCQPHTGSGAGYVGGWHGPYYSANRNAPGAPSDPGAGRSGQVTRTEISTRGGFGSFGRAMRAVG
jgi:hypothetical protein